GDVVVAGDRVLQLGQRHGLRFLDLLLGAVADEDRLAAPLGRDRHARLDGRNVDVDGGKRQRRGIGSHLVDEWPDGGADADHASHAGSDVEEIAAVMIGRFVRAHGHWVLSPYYRRKEPAWRQPTPS